jgi:methyl-accepting chemotaxis protein
MSTSEQPEKIDILIEQVGRMTEGITEVRLLVERVAQTVERVAQTTEQQAVVAAQQAESITRLITMLEKQNS